MTDALIDVRNVSKRFGDCPVLNGLSFRLKRGETFAFRGRNGTGKTTTIKRLLGLLRPDAGNVSVLRGPPHLSSG
jgi:ABC-2 type transport system ATP-binding protein